MTVSKVTSLLRSHTVEISGRDSSEAPTTEAVANNTSRDDEEVDETTESSNNPPVSEVDLQPSAAVISTNLAATTRAENVGLLACLPPPIDKLVVCLLLILCAPFVVIGLCLKSLLTALLTILLLPGIAYWGGSFFDTKTKLYDRYIREGILFTGTVVRIWQTETGSRAHVEYNVRGASYENKNMVMPESKDSWALTVVQGDSLQLTRLLDFPTSAIPSATLSGIGDPDFQSTSGGRVSLCAWIFITCWFGFIWGADSGSGCLILVLCHTIHLAVGLPVGYVVAKSREGNKLRKMLHGAKLIDVPGGSVAITTTLPHRASHFFGDAELNTWCNVCGQVIRDYAFSFGTIVLLLPYMLIFAGGHCFAWFMIFPKWRRVLLERYNQPGYNGTVSHVRGTVVYRKHVREAEADMWSVVVQYNVGQHDYKTCLNVPKSELAERIGIEDGMAEYEVSRLPASLELVYFTKIPTSAQLRSLVENPSEKPIGCGRPCVIFCILLQVLVVGPFFATVVISSSSVYEYVPTEHPDREINTGNLYITSATYLVLIAGFLLGHVIFGLTSGCVASALGCWNILYGAKHVS